MTTHFRQSLLFFAKSLEVIAMRGYVTLPEFHLMVYSERREANAQSYFCQFGAAQEEYCIEAIQVLPDGNDWRLSSVEA